MSLKRPRALTICAFFFLTMGILTVLGVIASWHFNSIFSWQYFLYAVMDFVLSYGFFSMHYWLLPALALNWASGIALTTVKVYMHPPTATASAQYLFSIALASVVLYALYVTPRKKLVQTTQARYAAVAFFTSWLAITCYTVINLFA